ncbi:sulfate ABC transporter, ATP-binding protein [Escherichia coli]|uniref:Sulfate ABC transporter, ATP-binding protein n=1 Tax=Escherichia coli TaxID=562 RepID=A0A376SBR9_ECOLX|nr:sulfate ABC transporter, ATP-binding protein [Escherichia coli]
MHGDDAPQRGERLFVGLQHARLYNGDERIETRDEDLLSHKAPDRLSEC